MEAGHPDYIEDGAVLLNGRVIDRVDRFDRLKSEVGLNDVIDLGDAFLIPGLVNAHTHLCLSHLKQSDAPPQPFHHWILSIVPRIGRDTEQYESNLVLGIEEGVRQCLQFGVTTVADITMPLVSQRGALARSPLRARSFIEALGIGTSRHRFTDAINFAQNRSDETERFSLGIAPHAPYTVDRSGFVECVAANMPISVHLAETPVERDFLNHHRGGFREVYDWLGVSLADVERFSGTPMELMKQTGVLDSRALLAHVNYVDDSDLDLLSSGNSSVVFCPRTHEFFGHAPHRFREMLARGINVCLGTDSCASSPDLNLVDDARLVRRLAPEMSARSILEMITIRGARALQMEKQVGSISLGKSGDFCAFNVSSFDELLEETVLPSAIWIDAKRLQ